MSLVRAERRRFMKRRMTTWMMVIGVLILAAVITGFSFTHEKATPATLAAAEARAEANFQASVAQWEPHRARCEEAAKQASVNGKEMTCEGPQRQHYKAEYEMPPQFKFKENFGELIIIWAAIIAMVGFLLGATFVGAEWNSGAMMQLLTWKPRRMTVLGTKLGVVLGWMTVIGVGTFGLWTGALYAVGKFAGNVDGMTPGTWKSFGLYGLRGLAMILAFTAMGFALASLGRHTALALGVAVAVVIVGQIGLAIVLQMAQVQFWEQYMIPVHMDVWLNKEYEMTDWTTQVCTETGCGEALKKMLRFRDTGYKALAGVGGVLALAFWSMRRRDIA